MITIFIVQVNIWAPLQPFLVSWHKEDCVMRLKTAARETSEDMKGHNNT